MGYCTNLIERLHHLQQKLGNGYAALILILGLLSGAAMLGLLVEIIEEIWLEQTLGAVDLMVFQRLQHLGNPFLNTLFMSVTRLGNPPAILMVAAACGGFLLYARRHLEAFALAGCLASTAVMTIAMKWLLLRNRPTLTMPLLVENNPAFPSGHASLSLVVYGFAAYLIAQQLTTTSHRLLIVCLGLSLAVFIGFSRLYLGVHWLSDVLGGYMLGGIWLTLLLTIAELNRFVRLTSNQSK